MIKNYEFGRKFRESRLSHSITKKDMAAKLGCNLAKINEMELGYVPSSSYLRDICSIFNIPCRDLIGDYDLSIIALYNADIEKF
jgi:transcriptional regulator with XRE-family HTH domain